MKEIKDDKRFMWTEHAKRKLQFYQLSPSKIRSIINTPDRREEAIVEGLGAAMRTAGSSKNRYEIWTMYATVMVKESVKLAG